MNELSSLKNKIILTTSLATSRRFVHKLNLKGEVVLNYVTHTMTSLIQELLSSKFPHLRVISNEESAYIFLKLIEKNDYQLEKYVKTIGASLKLLEVLNDYRLNDNETFNSLNPADYQKLLKDYHDYLSSKDLIDYISALKLIEDERRNDTIYLMSDISLRPLELKVLNKIFNNQLINIDDEGSEIEVQKIFECYGQNGEILNLLDFIEQEHLPLGDIEVLYTSDIFENSIKGLCEARKIPFTLKRVHAKMTNLISFIYDVLDYFRQDYKYELLEKVLSNLGLDPIYLKEFYKTIPFAKYVVGFSYLRSKEFLNVYENEKDVKHFYQLFKDLLSVTEDGNKLDYKLLLHVADTYISAYKEKEVLGNKLEQLDYIISHEDDFNKKIDLILRELDNLSYSEKDDEKSLSFAMINRSFTLRKYLFVIGLNQNLLLGSDVENAFIKDINGFKEDLKGDTNIHLSEFKKKIMIDNLLYYLSHSDSLIYFSYSSDDKIELRDMTDGVYLLNLDNLPEKEIKKDVYHPKPIGESYFFTPMRFNNQEEEEQEYNNGEFKEVEDVIIKDTPVEEKHQPIIEEKETKSFTLSPSATKDLIDCPFRFYYNKILGITSVQFPSLNESEWLEANAKGTFFHKVMELYFKNYMSEKIIPYDEKTFEIVFLKALEETEATNPVSNQYIADMEIKEIHTAAKSYLKHIVSRGDFALYKPLANEYDLKDLEFKHPDCEALTFSGEIDRVDGYVNPLDNTLHLRIIDYKTGKYKKKNDHGYYQHVLYSYIIESALKENRFNLKYQHVIVDQFIYSYPFDVTLKENVYERNEFDQTSPDYRKVDTVIREFVISYLNKEKNYLQKMINYFDENYVIDTSGEGICQYCKYKKECIKRMMEGYKAWTIKKQGN